jgi:hypothetical protein
MTLAASSASTLIGQPEGQPVGVSSPADDEPVAHSVLGQTQQHHQYNGVTANPISSASIRELAQDEATILMLDFKHMLFQMEDITHKQVRCSDRTWEKYSD